MLTDSRYLAKTSSTPGKTQTINHFLINEFWYLVDLPGYGYAKASKTLREGFGKIIEGYVLKRENLSCLFILIDARLEPQKIDLSFMQFVGEKGIPICLLFTKCDKLGKNDLQKNISRYKKTLSEIWDELPPVILTSAEKRSGKEEILEFISGAITTWENTPTDDSEE
jgi:GTP-binding protein